MSSALSPAQAQTVGTFRWQLQPYCNVITTTITQSGGVYTVDGTDDLCGANPRAAVTGLAFLNANGTVSFGLSLVVPPSPTAIQLTATIDLGSLGGTWQDSAGNTGAFVFSPAAVSGSPRPAATPVFTAGLSAGGGRINNVGTPTASTDAANRGYVDSAVAAATAGLHVVSVSSGEWRPFASTDPLTFTWFSSQAQVSLPSTGSNFLSISPTTPVSLYGKSMQLTAVEFCYTASTSAELSYVEINLETAVSNGGTRSVLFSDTTDFTNAACRYIPLATPRTLTANDTVNLFVQGNWTVASATLTLGRASFVFAPTSTTLTPPSDIAPPVMPVALPDASPSTTPPRP
ncbi:MAG: hypothetical protein IT181_25795 [Acidobacteria bacterium]|nr:hypothetical protein [Acidobacteriota bacterium]